MPIEFKYPARSSGVSKSMRLDNNTNIAIEVTKRLIDEELDKYYIEEKITTSSLMKEMIRLSFTSNVPILCIEDKKYTIKDLIDNAFKEGLEQKNFIDFFNDNYAFVDWIEEIISVCNANFHGNIKDKRDAAIQGSKKYIQFDEIYRCIEENSLAQNSSEDLRIYNPRIDSEILRAKQLIGIAKKYKVLEIYKDIYQESFVEDGVFYTMSLISMLNTIQYGVLINQFTKMKDQVYELLENYKCEEDLKATIGNIERMCKKEFTKIVDISEESNEILSEELQTIQNAFNK